MTFVQQARQRRRMGFLTVALVDDGAVPLEAIVLECLDNSPRGTRLLPGRIDVLDSQ